jgi:stage III sporulation protein AG
MPQFLKNFFEKKDKKGVQSLVIMLICGVLLLLASQIFAGMGENLGINILPLATGSPWEQIETFDYAPKDDATATTLSTYLTRQLEDILSLAAGAGEVRVMIFMGNAANVFARNTQENIAATTEEDGEGGVRNIHTTNSSATYVMVRRSDGSEAPLMLQEISPAIEGIIIVAQGGGDVIVRDALTRAAQAVLGIAPHRIQVLEMR